MHFEDNLCKQLPRKLLASHKLWFRVFHQCFTAFRITSILSWDLPVSMLFPLQIWWRSLVLTEGIRTSGRTGHFRWWASSFASACPQGAGYWDVLYQQQLQCQSGRVFEKWTRETGPSAATATISRYPSHLLAHCFMFPHGHGLRGTWRPRVLKSHVHQFCGRFVPQFHVVHDDGHSWFAQRWRLD